MTPCVQGDPRKPKGKMSAYAYFIKTCRQEHEKKTPEVPVNFTMFSKKCSERWKVRTRSLERARCLGFFGHT